jgi:hypothetical protein
MRRKAYLGHHQNGIKEETLQNELRPHFRPVPEPGEGASRGESSSQVRQGWRRYSLTASPSQQKQNAAVNLAAEGMEGRSLHDYWLGSCLINSRPGKRTPDRAGLLFSRLEFGRNTRGVRLGS